MDRMIVYPGAIPLASDILWLERFKLYGLARLAESVIGTATVASGLACTPTAPASLNVNVAYGSIYQQVAADATAYGNIGTDPNLLVKQGNINPLSPGGTIAATFAITPPAVGGQSQNYLIQATYTDTDASPVTLLYLNTSNPPLSYAQPWSGPNNLGQAQNTNRDGVCSLSIKAGVAATTGTQVTPNPDANNIGLWVITVANGDTTITAGKITQYNAANFIVPLTAANTVSAFREVIQLVQVYGNPPAAPGTLADTPVMVFSKANTPGIFFSFPVTTKVNLNLPVKVRLFYTTDINGGNVAVQLQYQVFTTGAISPASYNTAGPEAVPAPVTAGNMSQYQTLIAVIPSGALALNAFINCILTRQGGNGIDTNLGNFQLLQITLEQ